MNFCESCGRHPGRLDRLRGRGIAPCADGCGVYVCPSCQHRSRPTPTVALGSSRRTSSVVGFAGPTSLVQAVRSATGYFPRSRLVASPALVSVVILAIAALGVALSLPLNQPRPTGQVLDARQAAPSRVPALGAVPTTRPTALGTSPTSGMYVPSASARPTTPSALSSSPPGSTANVVVSGTALHTWRGAYGEQRLQVIFEVTNTSSGWLRLPRSVSTYEVFGREKRSVAGGVLAAALPEFLGPGETSYLVDTQSVLFGRPGDFVRAAGSIIADAVPAPADRLTVDSIELSSEPGGLRASGRVRNDGSTTPRSIIVGIVVRDTVGQPLAALYDLTDVTELAPGASAPFDTDYPGAPDVPRTGLGSVLGYAFSSDLPASVVP